MSRRAQATAVDYRALLANGQVIISVRDVTVTFGDRVILDKLSLDIKRGAILGFVGASGVGKSVLLRTILGLIRKQSGTIKLFDVDLEKATNEERLRIDMRLGMLFQHGALFSALTVLENVQVPMREYLDLPRNLMDELAMLKIELVGLLPDVAYKYPPELSGGMIKRAALARALALDPDIVFLDEPTSGLDPIGAAEFDELVTKMRDTMGLTVYMVTHDLDSLFSVCDRIAVLSNKKVLIEGTIDDMLMSEEPWVCLLYTSGLDRRREESHRPQGQSALHAAASSAYRTGVRPRARRDIASCGSRRNYGQTAMTLRLVSCGGLRFVDS